MTDVEQSTIHVVLAPNAAPNTTIVVLLLLIVAPAANHSLEPVQQLQLHHLCQYPPITNVEKQRVLGVQAQNVVRSIIGVELQRGIAVPDVNHFMEHATRKSLEYIDFLL